MDKVIILGTGCAGLTAAIYAARANLNPRVIEGTQPGGQLTTTSEVENFPGFPEGIDGFDLMHRLRQQAQRFGATFTSDRIESIEPGESSHVLVGQNERYETEAVIVATGASPRVLEVPGEKELWGGKGVTTCATCDGAFYQDKDVVVIGGGDTAAEEALFLTRFASSVTVIHRRDELRASQIMADRLLNHEKIRMAWNTKVTEMLSGEDGKARGVATEDTVTGATGEIAASGIFIAIGHIPNTSFLEGVIPLDEEGYVAPSGPSGSQVSTAVPGIYVAGDCTDKVYRQAITAAGMGCASAIEAERWLAEREPVATAAES